MKKFYEEPSLNIEEISLQDILVESVTNDPTFGEQPGDVTGEGW